jgi:phospholipase C
MNRVTLCVLFSLISAGIASIAPVRAAAAEVTPNTPIEHLVVLMQENHSFDNYFGTYPGAEGFPPDTCVPVDPFAEAKSECVAPYHISDRPIVDPDHSVDTALLQHNRGAMDGFIYALNARHQDGTIAMGYYDERDIPYYWNVADEYVLFDHFFSSAWGDTVWNHMFWFSAAPGSAENHLPPDGVGDLPTIFDRLEQQGVSWKVYVRNYDPTLTYRSHQEGGNRPAQVSRLPLLNIPRYLDDPNLFSHIVDLDDYFTDLETDTLPAVSFIIPFGASEHPPGSVQAGQRWVKSLVSALVRSPSWFSSAFMLTYDDWGGWYDHVPPPQVDGYGYGFRVPALLVSPYAKRGYIDSTQLDFTSILKFIEENYGLEPLTERDAQANSIENAFDFSQPPRQPEFLSSRRGPEIKRPEPRRSILYFSYAAAPILSMLLVAWASGTTVIRHRRHRSQAAKQPSKDDT